MNRVGLLAAAVLLVGGAGCFNRLEVGEFRGLDGGLADGPANDRSGFETIAVTVPDASDATDGLSPSDASDAADGLSPSDASDAADAPSAPAALQVSPTGINVGQVSMGMRSPPASLVVTNVGGATSGPVTVRVAPSNEFSIAYDDCSESPLSPGARCTVAVALQPAAVGKRAATLTVAAMPGGQAAATLQGTGVGLAVLSISPATAELICDPATFTVTNMGASSTNSLRVEIIGKMYTQTMDGCSGVVLAPMGSCIVQVAATFPASTAINATLSGTLQVTDGTASTSARLTEIYCIP